MKKYILPIVISLLIIGSGIATAQQLFGGTVCYPYQGCIGQDSSGWTGLAKITSGIWATGTVSASDLTLTQGNIFLGNASNVAEATTSGQDLTLSTIGSPTFTTIQNMQDIFHSAGWVLGGVISDAGSATIDVTAGSGFIRAIDGATTTLSFFDWPATTSLAIASGSIRYIGVEYNAGTPQVVVKSSDSWTRTTDFPLGTIVNDAGILHLQQSNFTIGDHAANMVRRVYEVGPLMRDNRTGGIILSETGTRNITVSAGTLWDRLNRFAISAIDTSGADTFDIYFRDGSSGFIKISATSSWDNIRYDDNSGTLATLGANKYAVQWFYIELDGELVSMYGQTQFNNSASAESESPPSSTPNRLSAHGKLIGRIIFKKGQSTTEAIESIFDTVFTSTLAQDHGNLAGLTDDDHTQYSLVDGTRAFTGEVSFNDNLYIDASGNVATGTWQGTIIATDFGGTGTSTDLTEGNLWIGNPDGNLAQIASSSIGGTAGVESNWSIDATGTALFVTSTIEFVGIGLINPSFKLEISASSSSGYFGISDIGEGDIFIVDEFGNVGIGTSSPDSGNQNLRPRLYIDQGSSGSSERCAVTSQFCIENDGHVEISFLSPNNKDNRIIFGDQNNNDVGKIVYDHGIDMSFTVEAIEVLAITQTQVIPGADSTIDSGATNRFWDQTFTDELILTNDGASSAAADRLVLSAFDLTAGNTILDINTEGSGMVATNTTPSADTEIAVRINGKVFYLLASSTAP